MLMEGKALRVEPLNDGFFEVIFDKADASANTLGQAAMQELAEAVSLLEQQSGIRGVLFSSAKTSFILGADITEFGGLFTMTEEEFVTLGQQTHALFNRIEDLPCPTVTAINGQAFGGGCELALATDYRVMAQGAKVGLPEVKLGLLPGWGGTVRLPRLIGIDNANEWICGGADNNADKALKVGAVDAVVEPDNLHTSALQLLQDCAQGIFDYQARRHEKQNPVLLNSMEQMMAFESAKGMIMKDQQVKKVTKKYAANAKPVERAAVLGAGIMGGGIAYQSASRGIPILMKDINDDALQLGLDEATKLLGNQVKRGKLDAMGVAKVISKITPTLSYGDINRADLVVEAVVENEAVKKIVLQEVEENLPEGAILASNTSTISITELATTLSRPESFCGMHFFNPVHRMPLVEVIRGEKSSDEAIARTVAYAKAMGKTPIVVNDCPGFLVNRVLFPYFFGFASLLNSGADFLQVDKVMEKFGWPMGPAYLLDVVGMDTGHHGGDVMAKGFPDRMAVEGESAMTTLYELGRYGQKTGSGFYRYEMDKRGKLKKLIDEEVPGLIAGVTPVEMFYRDNRLNPIHEGTTGIQSLDLLARKVPMNKMTGYQAVLVKMNTSIAQAREQDQLKGYADELEAALATLEQTTLSLLNAMGTQNIDLVLANSVKYLEIFGHIIIAWLWLKQGIVAAKALAKNPHDSDQHFYQGKLQALQYFYRYELPLAPVCALLLTELDSTCYDMQDNWF